MHFLERDYKIETQSKTNELSNGPIGWWFYVNRVILHEH